MLDKTSKAKIGMSLWHNDSNHTQLSYYNQGLTRFLGLENFVHTLGVALCLTLMFTFRQTVMARNSDTQP